jgi:hypothetical protein
MDAGSSEVLDLGARLRTALAGPYGFLVQDLGFQPDGDIGTRENRPGDDAWQVLRRGDLVLSLALHGDLTSGEPRLELTPEATVWTLGEAFGTDLATFAGDQVAHATEVVPLLVRHVEAHGLDATTRLVDAAAARLRSVVGERLNLCEDVEGRWRATWADLDVVAGVRDDVAFSHAVRGVVTRPGIVAETVLDWRTGTASTRLRRDEAATTNDLADLLGRMGADADVAALDRAGRRDDRLRAAARLGVRLVQGHWGELRGQVRG